MERDPTPKQHDFCYLANGSYFVLIEDLRQELATIQCHMLEYPVVPEHVTGIRTVRCPYCTATPVSRVQHVEWQEAEHGQEGCQLEAHERRRREEAERAQSRHDCMRRMVSLVNLKQCTLGADGVLFDLDGEPGSAHASESTASQSR